ncbi:AI-2E family transporter [Motilibacter aurantiacus]|uniref:AI-2E family transporter n=1 Tax=Motilibacter aurantiacus TaxID=2714955 RepID=UPI001407B1D0|nr:AI-2E family transporter [Motilibacter aurantiacus]NHC45706.1 AI-2E family transporter [Motilibacter aurantiacus]
MATKQQDRPAVPAAPAPQALTATGSPLVAPRERIPWRTIWATIGAILVTALALLLVERVARILVWIAIAAFFAVALAPLVGLIQRRGHMKRSVATSIVWFGGLVVLGGLVAVLVTPLVRQSDEFREGFPQYVEDARNGRGPIGDLIERFNVDQYVRENEDRIRETLTGLGTPAAHALMTAGEVVVALLTIFVLSFLMVLEGPKLMDSAMAQLTPRRESHVRRVAHDCARAVTGYITGALLIATICGLLTWLVLTIMDVPYAGVIALFVAVCDLIPLIGATLGAVVATLISLVESVPAAIVVAVWFVIYQQLENHLFQPIVQSRTVKLNPLTVLVSVLLGVELAGILGALLAIPVAGVLQVIVRDVYDTRRGKLKAVPTTGEEETPIPPHPAVPAR